MITPSLYALRPPRHHPLVVRGTLPQHRLAAVRAPHLAARHPRPMRLAVSTAHAHAKTCAPATAPSRPVHDCISPTASQLRRLSSMAVAQMQVMTFATAALRYQLTLQVGLDQAAGVAAGDPENQVDAGRLEHLLG